MSPLEKKVNRGLLKHAVARFMFCPIAPAADRPPCGQVLDARRAIGVWHHNRLLTVGCPGCVEAILERSRAKAPDPEGIEILRGADLW